MNKREYYFNKIEEYKTLFRKLSTDEIKKRLSFSSLYKEAAIAYHEILEERGI